MRRILALAGLIVALGMVPAWAQGQAGPVRDSVLCRSQLELLISRGRLTAAEAADFDAQCACMEDNERDGTDRTCTKSEL